MIVWHGRRCDFCGICVGVCPTDSVLLGEAELLVDRESCTECLNCVKCCPFRALEGDARRGNRPS